MPGLTMQLCVMRAAQDGSIVSWVPAMHHTLSQALPKQLISVPTTV